MNSEIQNRVIELAKLYGNNHAVLIPALHIIQDTYGFINDENINKISKLLNLPKKEIEETLSFYTMFRKKEVGKYHIQLCQNISCYLRGAENILTYIKNKLNIDVGQKTEDNLFSLSTVECLGNCGKAPVMQINDDYYEELTTERVDEILGKLTCDV